MNKFCLIKHILPFELCNLAKIVEYVQLLANVFHVIVFPYPFVLLLLYVHLLSIETNVPNKDIDAINFALNEIAVSRKNTTSMITVETHLNGEYLTSYWSDGLIISTATGSTGYSLSCGGPVITPETNSFVITPIAPHNLSARPLIITDSTEIQLKVTGREESHLVSLDSRIATLENGTIITINKAPFKIKMIDLLNESFLTTLRKKLLWGEDSRN